jgi:5'-methylthioadenosine phosphorylase
MLSEPDSLMPQRDDLPPASLLILIAVLLPPKALDVLGPVVEERTVLTPYGEAGPLALRVTPNGDPVWVQPYTGLPTRTDARATMYAARQLGVRRVLNWDAGIALNPVLQRGEPAIVADYISWITHQADSFFAPGPGELGRGTGSRGMAGQEPPGQGGPGRGLPLRGEMDRGATSVRSMFCPQLVGHLQGLMPGVPQVVAVGADFARRETPAEARMFRLLGADALSYNLVPEVALAHEVGLCYAGLLTLTAPGADRPPGVDDGSVRATLHALADLLPIFVALANGPATCRCAAEV